MLWSDPGVSVGYGSGCFGRIRVRVFWSDPDPGVLVGSISGYFGRIRIRFLKRCALTNRVADPDPGDLIGSGFLNKVESGLQNLVGYGSGQFS